MRKYATTIYLRDRGVDELVANVEVRAPSKSEALTKLQGMLSKEMKYWIGTLLEVLEE